MSARINLAPEVYQTSQRNKQRRKLATSVTVIVSIVSVSIVVGMLLLVGGQAALISSLQKGIDDKKKEIQQIPDVQKAVTLEDHLKSWKELSGKKVYLSRFFKTLQEFAPQGISVGTLEVDENNVLEVRGTTKTYALATKFAKALDAANVEIGPNASANATPFFSGTELGTVSEQNGTIEYRLTSLMSSEVTRGN